MSDGFFGNLGLYSSIKLTMYAADTLHLNLIVCRPHETQNDYNMSMMDNAGKLNTPTTDKWHSEALRRFFFLFNAV